MVRVGRHMFSAHFTQILELLAVERWTIVAVERFWQAAHHEDLCAARNYSICRQEVKYSYFEKKFKFSTTSIFLSLW